VIGSTGTSFIVTRSGISVSFPAAFVPGKPQGTPHSAADREYKSECNKNDFAKPKTLAISWVHLPVASKLRVALQGNPPPTPLYAAHRFAQRGFPRRLGPFRVALTTLNGNSKALPMFCLSFFNCTSFQVTEYDFEK
jgi:hypothetical protein